VQFNNLLEAVHFEQAAKVLTAFVIWGIRSGVNNTLFAAIFGIWSFLNSTQKQYFVIILQLIQFQLDRDIIMSQSEAP